jgi:hypothetical protein
MFTEIFTEWIIVAVMEIEILNSVDANPMTVIGTVIATFIILMVAHMFAIYKSYKRGE